MRKIKWDRVSFLALSVVCLTLELIIKDWVACVWIGMSMFWMSAAFSLQDRLRNAVKGLVMAKVIIDNIQGDDGDEDGNTAT